MATTVIPTTLAPTTLGPTSLPEDVTIVCDPLEVTLFQKGIRSYYPDHGRDTLLDYLHIVDPIEIELSQEGDLGSLSGSGTNEIELELLGSIVEGETIVCSPIEIELIFPTAITFITGGRNCNWVWGSRIGQLDFTIDERNIAFKRPMDWKGCIYDIIKLGNGVVVYGENGVTILRTADINWAMKTIHRIGTQCKGAAVGNEFEHYFIDQKDRLYKLLPESVPELLDYSEYLETMTNPRMYIDYTEDLLYICDGTVGFVYGIRTKSFGSGPVNISGIGKQSGLLYVTAPSAIEIPKFSICTDIYDFGTRRAKTIQEIELGTDLTDKLQVMIETRIDNKEDFRESQWKIVNPAGRAQIPCFGVEFKFHVQSRIYEYLELDYIKVHGTMHEFNYLNQV